ncbi:NAD(P)H-hydrate dehydratase [Candidatus Woesearchaeota archaeon]|nr:NAD(P)H-hydrate dehydratase [Candidatus Woesearchaeota archaeon]RLE43375.1 MAG: NAD(P)H-hydrate dehydratase [Candidatus Woesearchaeota archaeon]
MKPLPISRLRYERPGIGEHKGDNGRVLVIGGSRDFVGAVYLAGMASLRSGADVVIVAAPEDVAFAINAMTPDLVTVKLPGDYLTLAHYTQLTKLAKGFDVMLFGNGMGLEPGTMELCRRLALIPMFKVIDADALKAISLQGITGAVLTPHLREFQELFRNTTQSVLTTTEHEAAATQSYKELRAYLSKNVIVLKGRVDYVLSSQGLFYNKLGNPRMRVAGTGDILAGVIAGLLAQTKSLMESVGIGLPAVCRAATQLYSEMRGGYTASDILMRLPKAIFK